MKFLLVSNNKHKLQEMQRILSPLGIELVTAAQIGISLANIEENGATFEENAKIKAMAGFQRSGLPSIADDSGLAIDALGGRPGVYSARYCGEGTPDSVKNENILKELENVNDAERTAKFVCCICCIVSENTELTAKGECLGKIGYKQIGDNGFGYDPIFNVAGGKSFAQLTDDEKDKISHRGKALKAFYGLAEKYINSNIEGN